MKILLTGAHFTPAQAVIEELHKVAFSVERRAYSSSDNIELIYIGRNRTLEDDKAVSIESQVLPEMGVKFLPLIAGRVRRSLDIYTLISLLKIPIGFIQSFYYIWKYQPDVVVSFGGYVGVPVVLSAWILSKPIITHEQTLVAGLANSVSNIFANKIALTFKPAGKFDTEKIVVTGNPIREEILHPVGKASDEISDALNLAKKQTLPVIYVTGGNQGAHFINEAISKIISDLTSKYIVIHQTGDSKYQDFEKLSEIKSTLKNPERLVLKKWVDSKDVGIILKNTDLVISRCGANTLLELSLWQIPTIMIPLPTVLKDEQTKNARFFKEAGLGEVITQSSLTSTKLLELINKMIKNKDEYKKQAENAKSVVILDAAQKLTLEILNLAS